MIIHYLNYRENLAVCKLLFFVLFGCDRLITLSAFLIELKSIVLRQHRNDWWDVSGCVGLKVLQLHCIICFVNYCLLREAASIILAFVPFYSRFADM